MKYKQVIYFKNIKLKLYILIIILFIPIKNLFSLTDTVLNNLILGVGTKEERIGWKFSENFFISRYYKFDKNFNKIESGATIYKKISPAVNLKFKISSINKDSILKNSLFMKQDINFILYGFNVKTGIGIITLPELKSREPGTEKNISPTFITGYYNIFYGTDANKIDEKTLWANIHSFGITGINPIQGYHDNYPYTFLNFLSWYYISPGFGIKYWFLNKIAIGLDYFNYSHFLYDFSYLKNHYITPLLFFKISKNILLKHKYYYNLTNQIYFDNYFLQGNRLLTELLTPKIKFTFIWNFDLQEIIAESEYTYKKNINIFLYAINENKQTSFGIQFKLNLKSKHFFKNINFKYNMKPQNKIMEHQSYISLSNPPQVENLTFDEITSVLNTPEKAAWYAGNFLNYDYDYTSGIFSPEETFNNKKGVCMEQMSFQSYCLRKNGYNSYTLVFDTCEFSHALCIYQDKKTGKWNAIEYDDIYYTYADSPSEVLEQIYPGWVSWKLYNPETEEIKKIFFSETEQYIFNWFEN